MMFSDPQPTKAVADAAHRDALVSIGLFAAAMAHEIRNPLTAIKARLFTLERSLDSDSPAREDAVLIGQEIARLERTVREFLQYARPAEPSIEPVKPAEIFASVIALLEPQISASKIRIAVESTDSLVVAADAHQLRQVLINLVQNAAESIGTSGTITLRARKGEESPESPSTVILEVADTGKGIPEELHPHLFDPFFTDKPSGTGLGLPTAARVIHRHGGSISFTSEVDRGTTFRVTLPAASWQ
jgi:signal transduction histidine kinase